MFLTTGTHDIQNVRVDSPRPGEIRMRGSFVDQVTATSVVLIIYSDDLDIIYYNNKSIEQNINVHVTGLTGTWYGISTFALEMNGLPFPRAVSSPKNINVSSSENQGFCKSFS